MLPSLIEWKVDLAAIDHARKDFVEYDAALRGGRKICPRGVYRFKTFEEADEWMHKMITQSSLEYLLAQQNKTDTVGNSKPQGKTNGLIRRLLEAIRRVFYRPEKE